MAAVYAKCISWTETSYFSAFQKKISFWNIILQNLFYHVTNQELESHRGISDLISDEAERERERKRVDEHEVSGVKSVNVSNDGNLFEASSISRLI